MGQIVVSYYDQEKLDKSGKYFQQWNILADNTYLPISKTTEKLPAGYYLVKRDINDNFVFDKLPTCSDDIIKFSDPQVDKILNEVNSFWGNEKIFKDNGFLQRRGILLHGPSGAGKTALLKILIKELIDMDGIVINCCSNPEYIVRGLSIFRQVEPTRKIICIFEDIDGIIKNYTEEKLLSLLDGENSTDYTLNIATTNFPENLSDRIVSRPRRFDRIVYIDYPNENIRKQFFKLKLNLSDEKLDLFVRKTKNYSFASLSELVISTLCFGYELEEALEILNGIKSNKPSSNEYTGGNSSIGFSTFVEDEIE
jgi:hypothetical protein